MHTACFKTDFNKHGMISFRWALYFGYCTTNCSVPPALNIQKILSFIKTFQSTQKLRYPNSDLQLLLFKPF
jgi:hypothetical protein